MTDITPTQEDIHAAKLYLQGAGPWKLDEIGIGENDYLVQCFARHRQAAIASVIAHATSADALKRAEQAWMNRDLADPNSNPIRDAITAALTESQMPYGDAVDIALARGRTV
jgi:hypothetical protein